MIVPGSGLVKQQAEAEGLDAIFIAAVRCMAAPGTAGTAAWLHGCMAAPLHGCMAAWLHRWHRCMAAPLAPLHGCTAGTAAWLRRALWSAG
jgi:hypothetical protein